MLTVGVGVKRQEASNGLSPRVTRCGFDDGELREEAFVYFLY